MNKKINKYLKMQKNFYLYGTNNHEEHNKNNDYWNILLKPLIKNEIPKNEKILDYGCGKGRNVINFICLGYKNAYGVDISQSNINYCKKV